MARLWWLIGGEGDDAHIDVVHFQEPQGLVCTTWQWPSGARARYWMTASVQNAAHWQGALVGFVFLHDFVCRMSATWWRLGRSHAHSYVR